MATDPQKQRPRGYNAVAHRRRLNKRRFSLLMLIMRTSTSCKITYGLGIRRLCAIDSEPYRETGRVATGYTRRVYLLSVLTLETAGMRSSFHYLYYKYLHNVQ